MKKKTVLHKPLYKRFHNYIDYKRILHFSYHDLVRWALTSIVAVIAVQNFFSEHYENVFTCCLTLFLFSLPAFAEEKFKIDIPPTLEIVIFCFIFAAQILGEIESYYTIYPYWDTMLHTSNGFLAAAVGFSMVDLLNRSEKYTFNVSPFFLVFTGFCFSMTIGAVWEMFEFAMDFFFGMDMQKDTIVTHINSVIFEPNGLNTVITVPIHSIVINGEDWFQFPGGYVDIGLIDTMIDIIVNFIGALIFSIIAFISLISKSESKFIKKFLVLSK